MGSIRDRLRSYFRPMPADSEPADCGECGRGVAPYEGHRDHARGMVWCSDECVARGMSSFAI